jgi:aryl-alcohol dehydrogenase (NADP+)
MGTQQVEADGRPSEHDEGIDIHPLALGTNTFGWTADEAMSHRILDTFVASGGKLIDSADGYSAWVPGHTGGESESVIGSWLAAGGLRDQVLITSKVSGNPNHPGLSARNIAEGIKRSLERLRTDYLDVYYAHFDDPTTPLDETVGAFEDLRREGLVRQIGLSNYSGARIEEWIKVAREAGAALPTVLQPNYNLIARLPFEDEVRPVAERNQLAVVPYFGLASGFLTGKYRTLADLVGVARSGFLAPYATQRGFAIVSELVAVADDLGTEPATVALAWLRLRPTVTAVLASASRLEQIGPLLDSASLEIPADHVERLTRASRAAS